MKFPLELAYEEHEQDFNISSHIPDFITVWKEIIFEFLAAWDKEIKCWENIFLQNEVLKRRKRF